MSLNVLDVRDSLISLKGLCMQLFIIPDHPKSSVELLSNYCVDRNRIKRCGPMQKSGFLKLSKPIKRRNVDIDQN